MARALPVGGPVQATLQRRIWRWHFLAGLMVIPFAIVLAGSGALYLFKPQIEGWTEARVQAGLPQLPAGATPLTMDTLIHRAQDLYPGAAFVKLTLPRHPADRSVEIEMRTIPAATIVWMDRYTGQRLDAARKDRRLMAIAKRLHNSLFSGEVGAWVVEMMASWMIVLLMSGLYLWWPRGRAWWRVFLPRLSGLRQRRELWRRVHGAVGAWAASFILILLLSGLPWTSVWGAGFEWVQQSMGWTARPSTPTAERHPESHADSASNPWSRSSGAGDEPSLPALQANQPEQALKVEQLALLAQSFGLPPPVELHPPREDSELWTIRSATQNHPQQRTLRVDRWSGDVIEQRSFADYHPVQKAISVGIALHEGALFGWLNQLLGLLTALAVVLLSISGCIVWWKRRPTGGLGLPPMPSDPRLGKGFRLLILGLAAFLPLMALSLLICLVCDWLWQCGLRLRTR